MIETQVTISRAKALVIRLVCVSIPSTISVRDLRIKAARNDLNVINLKMRIAIFGQVGRL
jgi:hypothetical protein